MRLSHLFGRREQRQQAGTSPSQPEVRNRPSLEDYDDIKALPGYAAVSERLTLARSLVSHTEECFGDIALAELSEGAIPTDDQARHLATCRHCRALLDVVRAQPKSPIFAQILAAAAATMSADADEGAIDDMEEVLDAFDRQQHEQVSRPGPSGREILVAQRVRVIEGARPERLRSLLQDA